MTDPTCPTCGHPASEHGAMGCYHGSGQPNPWLQCRCGESDADVLRAALTAAQEEIERLKEGMATWKQAANDHYQRLMEQGEDLREIIAERNALARDAERLRLAMDRAIDALAQDDHPFDAELYEAWKANLYGGCASCKAVFILHDVARSAAPTTENTNNG